MSSFSWPARMICWPHHQGRKEKKNGVRQASEDTGAQREHLWLWGWLLCTFDCCFGLTLFLNFQAGVMNAQPKSQFISRLSLPKKKCQMNRGRMEWGGYTILLHTILCWFPFTYAIGPISDFFSILLQVIHSPMSPGVGKQIGQSLALVKGQANVQSVPLY
jgi:hypothetical protein